MARPAGIRIDIRPDLAEMNRDLDLVNRKILPKVTSRALNETATSARSAAIKQVSKTARLPQKNLKNRYRKNGEKKGERMPLFKATRGRLEARIEVYMRGIPAIQLVSPAQRVRSITGKAKKGVRATGPRLYKRGFVAEAPSGSGNFQLFARLGKKRHPVGVIKVGVRNRLTRAFDYQVKQVSRGTFRARFRRLMQYELTTR